MRWKELAGQLWSSQRGTLVLVAVLLALNLVTYLFMSLVVEPRVASREYRFLQRQAEVRELLRNQDGAVQSPENLYVLASQDLEKLYAAVPEYQEFTGLIEELLVLSNRSRLDIAQISYQVKELKEMPLLQVGLNFNVSGDYEQIKKFIHALEQSARLMSIQKINLQSVDDQGVKLQLNLETYFRPRSKEL